MTESSQLAELATESNGDEISILDLLIVLVQERRILILVPLIVAIISVGYTLLMPSIYTAETKLMPPQQAQSGSAAILSQLGGLGGLAGAVARGPGDLYVAMLRSRIVADNLIQRFGLATTPEEMKFMSSIRRDLAGRTNILIGKDGLISIEVDDADPKRAADIANAYVDELVKLTGVMAITEASQKRLFFEKQFEQASAKLAEAEIAARQALQNGGLVKVDDQGITMVQSSARLRAQITFKEVQISAMRAFAAAGNPDLQRSQQEIESMKRELAKLESPEFLDKVKEKDSGGQKATNSLRLLREVKYREAIYELLARQFEMSKIDEAKEGTVVQVLDKAIEPDRKSKPKRTLIVITSTVVAFILAMLFVIARDSLIKAARDPARADRIRTLEGIFRWRRA